MADLPYLNSLILLLACCILVFLTARYLANRSRIMALEKRIEAIEAAMATKGK